jgi:hypothetical protein
MSNLPMPSDLRTSDGSNAPAEQSLVEPPSAKLIVRLFLIPLLIVAAAVGVMFLIGLLAGGAPSVEQAIARLKRSGGERTADVLIGPGSKQRYMDAMTLTDKMKSGMSEAERIRITDDLIDVLNNHTKPEEGEVQHFLLLALGRAWQIDPNQQPMDDAGARDSRAKAIQTLQKYANGENVSTRKAALLALGWWPGREEVKAAFPVVIERLNDEKEDLDVRIAAATVLGPLGHPDYKQIVSALETAMRDVDPRNVELVWSASLSLAQLNQPEVADTILMLLDRKELAQLRYYDRESDPKNPSFRQLNDQEQQRVLINMMLGARKLQVGAVQDRLKDLAEHDPSPRVRAAGREMLKDQNH